MIFAISKKCRKKLFSWKRFNVISNLSYLIFSSLTSLATSHQCPLFSAWRDFGSNEERTNATLGSKDCLLFEMPLSLSLDGSTVVAFALFTKLTRARISILKVLLIILLKASRQNSWRYIILRSSKLTQTSTIKFGDIKNMQKNSNIELSTTIT